MTHAEAYFLSADVELVAVVDTDKASRERCAARWEVKDSYATAAELMQGSKPDIVSVCTPTGTHAAVIEELLSSGLLPKAILCEKPIAESLDDAERLVDLTEAKNVLLLVVHMRRYARNMQNLKQFLGDGGIGDLRGVSGWLTKGTLHNGTHWFDLLRFLVGEVESVSALDVLREPGSDPTLDVSLFLENGMCATMRAAEAANFTLCEMDILGTKGRARIVDSSYVVELTLAANSPRYVGYTELLPETTNFGDRKDVMRHAVEDIVRCLDNGSEPLSSGQDGVEALRIALAACESATTGRLVKLR